MAIDNVMPVHAINRFLWSRIKAEGILTEIPYQNKSIIPIVPVEETADLIEAIDAQPGIAASPYMVYNWTRSGGTQEWWQKTHRVAYSIRSTDARKLGQLANLFATEFESYDKAAQKLNIFLAALPPLSNGDPHPLKRFRFKHISLSTLNGGLPAESETDVNEALVTISVTYTE